MRMCCGLYSLELLHCQKRNWIVPTNELILILVECNWVSSPCLDLKSFEFSLRFSWDKQITIFTSLLIFKYIQTSGVHFATTYFLYFFRSIKLDKKQGKFEFSLIKVCTLLLPLFYLHLTLQNEVNMSHTKRWYEFCDRTF